MNLDGVDCTHFKANYLLKDELEYELRIRGVVTKKDVTTKRYILQRLLSKEDTPKIALTLVDSTYSFASDKQILTNAFDTIRNAIGDFEGTRTDSAYKRLSGKLIHLLFRTQRLQALEGDDDDEVTDFRNESYATVLELQADLDSRLTPDPVEVGRQSLDQVNLNTTQISCQGPSNNPTIINTVSSKHVPVYKWGLTFNGESKLPGLNSFLERVDELSVSRNVSKVELFSTASDLFTGKALLWYRAVKSTLTDWDSLVAALRKDFLPPDYEESLWDEVKSRYQGRNESIVLFLAVMESLFGRLSKVPSEQVRVRIIRKNLQPHFISQLALVETTTIEQLSTACRKIEDSIQMSQRCRPPNRPLNKSLEPELASTDHNSPSTPVCASNTGTIPKRQLTKKGNRRPASSVVVNSNDSRPNSDQSRPRADGNRALIVCWNCQLPNHTFSSCSLKRNKFCYRCGASGVTVKECLHCSPRVDHPEN